MKRGIIVVIDGTDSSGKRTQSEKLVDKLNYLGHKSEMMSFPRYDTPTGQIVGECYLGKNLRSGGGCWFNDADKVDPKIASLYYAADRRAALVEIREKIGGGISLVFDRYVEANMGHQCGKLKNSKDRAELSEWIDYLEYKMLELPRPDLVFFLHMPLKVSRKLIKNRNELDSHESNEQHLINAERAYLELADIYKWIKISCSEDGEKPRAIEEIHEEILNHIRSLTNFEILL